MNTQSLNRYAYVGNDPVNFVDPAGLDKSGIEIGAGLKAINEFVNVNVAFRLIGGAGKDEGSVLDEILTTDVLGAPQDTPLPSDLRDRVQDRLNNPNSNCADFTKRLIDEAARVSGKSAFSNNAMNNFDRIGQSNIILKNVGSKGEANFDGNRRVIHITPVPLGRTSAAINHTQNGYAATALNEVIHHSANSGLYNDRLMARAIFNLLSPEQQAKNPLPKSDGLKENSRYWHPLYLANCPGR